MSAWAYYNDVDEDVCAWVRELIKRRLITDGEVDCRDIRKVQPEELRGFRRVHFFNGIAVWDYSLRRAGWPDDAEVWCGSCPCQSFSNAGARKGFDDERNLWPEWIRLIRKCRPAVIFGEQVSGAIKHGWLDIVQTDLEAESYAVGKAVLGAASVGAPHIRQRLWFVAKSLHAQRRQNLLYRSDGRDRQDERRPQAFGESGACGEVRDLADAGISGREVGRWAGQAGGGAEHADRSRHAGVVGDTSRGAYGSESESGLRQEGASRRSGSDDRMDNSAGSRRRRTQPGSEEDPRNQARMRGSGSGCTAGWLGDTDQEQRRTRRIGQRGDEEATVFRGIRGDGIRPSGMPSGLADPEVIGECTDQLGFDSRKRKLLARSGSRCNSSDDGKIGGLADPDGGESGDGGVQRGGQHGFITQDSGAGDGDRWAGPLNGFWRDADWIRCTDGLWRPVKPGSQPLASGSAARLVRLRGYDNGLCAPVAEAFIRAAMEVL